MAKVKQKLPSSSSFHLSKKFYRQFAIYVIRDETFRLQTRQLLQTQKVQLQKIWSRMADLEMKERKVITAATEYIANCDKILTLAEQITANQKEKI